MMSKKVPSSNFLRSALVVLMMGFVGCQNQAASTSYTKSNTTVNDNLPQVVATTSVLCDLTRQVAQDTINLTCLIPPDTDPHLYRPKSEDRKAIEQANLILYNGYNLEPGLIKIIKSTKKSVSKIAVSQVAVPNPRQFLRNGQKVTDSHVWHNTKNAIKMVEVISSNLAKLEPSNKAIYSGNAKQLGSELTQIDGWIKSRIATIPINQRKLVTTHDALGYYTKAYNIPLAGALSGFSTEEQPTNLRVKNLVKQVKQAKVPTIFPDTITNSNLMESVANEAAVKLSERQLYTDGLGQLGSEADTYQKMMIANTRTIVEGLGGTYLIFEPK